MLPFMDAAIIHHDNGIRCRKVIHLQEKSLDEVSEWFRSE